jgi:hypothetical protein
MIIRHFIYHGKGALGSCQLGLENEFFCVCLYVCAHACMRVFVYVCMGSWFASCVSV